MRAERGFTLIELITVIVVLSVVAAIGSGFVVTAVESYRDTEQRAKLVQKGRLAIEQMTRQLRNALPHSLRVSPSGNCIEFIPIVGGANYLDPVPDAENGVPATSSIPTSAVNLASLGTPIYVSVGGLSETEIYNSGSPSALAGFSTIGAEPSVVLSSSHRFIRNSINNRLFITDSPKRFCLRTGELVEHTDYGLLTTPINDSGVGTETTIVPDVLAVSGSPAFALSLGSEDYKTAIDIHLNFQQGGSAVALTQQVLVRNVP